MRDSPIILDKWSFGSICVVPYECAAPLATATGFVLPSAKGHHYLVTNYHVATGKHPVSNMPIDPAGHLPDRLLLALPRNGPSVPALHWTPVVIQLFDDDYRPMWVEHPRYGSKFDVVLLPFSIPGHASCVAVDPKADDIIALFPGSSVSIVGFPHGLAGPALTAIWKTGAIASEPDLLVNDEDYFWIDANTRPGMSGAPVIARRLGSFLSTQGSVVSCPSPMDRLLGVYAGRAMDAKDMTLGRVWRWRGVEEILCAAEARTAQGMPVAPTGTIGHYLESPMPTIRNSSAQIVLPGPLGPITNTIHVGEMLVQVATLDERFGTSLERLKLAARVVAACNAAAPGGEIELPGESTKLLAECLRTPAGWGYPKGAHQVVDLIEQTASRLESIA